MSAALQNTHESNPDIEAEDHTAHVAHPAKTFEIVKIAETSPGGGTFRIGNHVNSDPKEAQVIAIDKTKCLLPKNIGIGKETIFETSALSSPCGQKYKKKRIPETRSILPESSDRKQTFPHHTQLMTNNIPPPPPPPVPPMLEETSMEDDHLTNMLMAWYMTGYYTGIYLGQKKNNPK